MIFASTSNIGQNEKKMSKVESQKKLSAVKMRIDKKCCETLKIF